MKSVLAAITTCKRKPEMVERAIKSVVAQTYTDWELVVVDESPGDYEFRDDVRRMVEGWSERDSRIRYVAHDRNYGAQRARNTALNIACDEKFEFIGYLDDDDEWLPEKLEKQVAKFNEHNENVALVYCAGIQVKDKQNVKYGVSKIQGMAYEKLLTMDFIGTFTSPLMRTKSLKAIGGMDESLPANQDYDTWVRIARSYEIACVTDTLYLKHNDEHGEQIIKNHHKYVEAREIIFRKNESYLLEHKDVYRLFLRDSIVRCSMAGEWRKCFRFCCTLLSLHPLKIFSNIWMIMYKLVIRRYITSPFELWLENTNVEWFYKFRNAKNKIKGAIKY